MFLLDGREETIVFWRGGGIPGGYGRLLVEGAPWVGRWKRIQGDARNRFCQSPGGRVGYTRPPRLDVILDT